MQRDEILHRYRQLRAISTRHHNDALAYLARPAFLEHAKYLGLAHGQTVVAESREEMTLTYDLAIHTAKQGRTRAIDRYAKAVGFSDGSDEARVLDGIRGARFSIWRIGRHHATAGLVVTDILREKEAWLVDEALTECARPGQTFAGRLSWPAEFAMTCNVIVPVDDDLRADIMDDDVIWSRNAEPHQLADDPRFAATIYRHAIDAGVMDRVVFREASAAA